jgi:SHS2 domain-containing protein
MTNNHTNTETSDSQLKINSKKFKYLPHTADVEFEAYGNSLCEVLANSVLAMSNTIADINKIKKDVNNSIIKKTYVLTIKDSASIGSDSEYDILWYLLQDTLSIADYRGVFVYKVIEIKIRKTKKKIYAIMKLESVKKANKYSEIEVKGVSRYNLSIKNIKGKYKTDVVIDI